MSINISVTSKQRKAVNPHSKKLDTADPYYFWYEIGWLVRGAPTGHLKAVAQVHKSCQMRR